MSTSPSKPRDSPKAKLPSLPQAPAMSPPEKRFVNQPPITVTDEEASARIPSYRSPTTGKESPSSPSIITHSRSTVATERDSTLRSSLIDPEKSERHLAEVYPKELREREKALMRELKQQGETRRHLEIELSQQKQLIHQLKEQQSNLHESIRKELLQREQLIRELKDREWALLESHRTELMQQEEELMRRMEEQGEKSRHLEIELRQRDQIIHQLEKPEQTLHESHLQELRKLEEMIRQQEEELRQQKERERTLHENHRQALRERDSELVRHLALRLGQQKELDKALNELALHDSQLEQQKQQGKLHKMEPDIQRNHGIPALIKAHSRESVGHLLILLNPLEHSPCKVLRSV
jgi:hypothetical protein